MNDPVPPQLSPVELFSMQAGSAIFQLIAMARSGDALAAKALVEIGLRTARGLEDLALEETRQSREGGVVRQLARKSDEWPFRLSAIKEKRQYQETLPSGKIKSTFDNPEFVVDFLKLGCETPINTDKTSVKGGSKREFQGRTGFASRLRKQIKSDLKQFEGMTPVEIRKSRYWSWNFNLDPSLGPIVPIERPASLHRLLQSYIESARKMKPGNVDDLTKVAMLCLRVQTEDDLERVDYWPAAVQVRKVDKDGTYAASLKEYLRSGFQSLIKT